MKSYFLMIAGLFFLAILAWFLMTYVLISEETRVSRVVEKARIAVKNGSLLTLANLLSQDYRDESGADRDIALAALKSLFSETSERKAMFLKKEVRVEANQAWVNVRFQLTLKGRVQSHQMQALIDQSLLEPRKISIELIKVGGKAWKIKYTSLNDS